MPFSQGCPGQLAGAFALRPQLPVILPPPKAHALLFQVCCPLHELLSSSPARCPTKNTLRTGESAGLKDGHDQAAPIVLQTCDWGALGQPHLVLCVGWCSSQHPTTSNSAQTPAEVQANHPSPCCLQVCSFCHSKENCGMADHACVHGPNLLQCASLSKMAS